jgi:hypothetical protein
VEHGRRFPRGVQRLGGQGLDVAKKKKKKKPSYRCHFRTRSDKISDMELNYKTDFPW